MTVSAEASSSKAVSPPQVETEANALSSAILGIVSTLPTTPSNEEAEAYVSALTPHLARLRALARRVAEENKRSKGRVAQRRAEVDESRLRLQNLEYERNQLEGEITRCKEFVSVFQDIRLRDLSDFQTMAPEELRTEETLNDAHKLMLARLEYELLERQQLEEERKALLSIKLQLLQANRSKASQIAEAETELGRLLSGTAKAVTQRLEACQAPVEAAAE